MFFLARLSRFKFGALPRTYNLFIVFLNWPSIQLNTYITRNRANYRIRLRVRFYFSPHTAQPIQIQSFSTNILWWGGWSLHHFSLHYSLCLEISILRHLHTRIRESILSISLSSHFSRAIGQSPYQFRVLAVTSRCVYRSSIVHLLV